MKLAVQIVNTGPEMFKAKCPSLPGCCADGHSQQEAMEKMDTAIRGYLASLDASVPASIEPLVMTA